MRKLLTSLLALALLAGAFSATAYSASKSVQVRDNSFSSKSLRIKRGDTVTWRWTGQAPHNVVVKNGPVKFSSKVQRNGSYKRKVTRGGTYAIVCTIHPGMAMTLKVR